MSCCVPYVFANAENAANELEPASPCDEVRDERCKQAPRKYWEIRVRASIYWQIQSIKLVQKWYGDSFVGRER